VYACDDAYTIPLVAAIRSLIDNAPDSTSLEIVIISFGISEHNRERLMRSWRSDDATVEFIEANYDGFVGLPLGHPESAVGSYINEATYGRLLLPQLLPDSWDRVIYLDVDTLVVSSLADMWNLDIEGRPIAAARDCGIRSIGSGHGVRMWNEIGIDPTTPYFSAGVMLVNLEEWRRTDIPGRVTHFLRTYRERVLYCDQEGLNAVLAGNYVPLGPEWNATGCWVREFLAAPAGSTPAVRIRHFTTAAKPWLATTAPDLPNYADFFQYLDRTDWKGWRPA
jgi:lipopolysaccharide biosynthesis glycosyltransferase